MKCCSNANLEEAANPEVVGRKVGEDEKLLVFVLWRGEDLDQPAVDPEHGPEGSFLLQQFPGHTQPAAEDPQPGGGGLLSLRLRGLVALVGVSALSLQPGSDSPGPGPGVLRLRLLLSTGSTGSTGSPAWTWSLSWSWSHHCQLSTEVLMLMLFCVNVKYDDRNLK